MEPLVSYTYTKNYNFSGAIPPVGALIGSLVSGPMMQVLGRRKTVLVASPLWAASWIVLATAQNYAVVLTGRICTGFCVGLVLPATQVYVSKMINVWNLQKSHCESSCNSSFKMSTDEFIFLLDSNENSRRTFMKRIKNRVEILTQRLWFNKCTYQIIMFEYFIKLV